MNEKVNRFNGITVLGKEHAERAIVSVIGNEVIHRIMDNFRTAEEKEERLNDILSDPLALTEWKSSADVIEGALRIIVRMYADPDYDDKKMSADCLVLRQMQLAERVKK